MHKEHIDKYIEEGYEGSDSCIETSLFEYGLIWIEINKEKKQDEYRFIYKNGELFSYSFMNKKTFIGYMNCEEFIDEENLKQLLSYCGQTKEQLIESFPLSVSDLVSYYGTENIFGTDYNPYEIVGET